ncbi:DinB family protein [Phytoactinopolyspora mesophila]|uniref:DUF664 domain-containing protein n=1 Tax=Phytoactinopolyspora mesophila TaxID=2650750 RepID=A0A7K3M3Z3_9ACTN|nr:DinB family protein [Phytoactinopolyspora mesophila]NDL57940.1 DUF664 domain-containing protein [Phytoactinopolyspora mesophila]
MTAGERTTSLDVKGELHRYLQQARETMLSKLEGLDEYDIRRPLTPTGTNLLGLVKHLTGVELGYLGDCVGRRSPIRLAWVDDGSIWESADMWATAEESKADLIALYQSAWQHSDQSLQELALDAPAHVPWWPEPRRETTLGALLIRVLSDTTQHAGHADIIRELIDGRAGADHDEVGDPAWWASYLARIQDAADTFRP